MKLPDTKARLVQSISLRAFLDTESDIDLINRYKRILDFLQFSLGGLKIGAVQSFTKKQTRKVYKRYALGKDSFEPFQVVPLGTNTSLSLEKVVLYKMDELEKVFSFLPNNLIFQTVPFVIELVEIENNKDSESNRRITLFTQCWFISNNIKYNITRDTIILQNVEVECGKMLVLEPSLAGTANLIMTEGKELIEEGINLIGGTANLAGKALKVVFPAKRIGKI